MISVGSSVPWKHLTPQDSLIILNFSPKDRVYYICDDGSLIYAEIIKCTSGKKSILEVLEPTLTIRVGEVNIQQRRSLTENASVIVSKSESNDDDSDDYVIIGAENNNSKDSNGEICCSKSDGDITNDTTDDHDAAILTVSPMQVFRIITTTQRRALWGGGTSPYACPLVLATIPIEDHAVLEQWLDEFYSSSLLNSHSRLMKSVLTLRLLGHLHHQLVTYKKALKIEFFTKAVQKVHNTFCLVPMELTSQQIQGVTNLLTKVIKEIPNDVKELFPTKLLGEILDNTCDQSPNQATIQSCNYLSSNQTDPPSTGSLHSCGNNHARNQKSSSTGVPVGNLQQYVNTTTRRGHRNPRFDQLTPQMAPQPDTCMKSAAAWLLQAKADFCAAKSLFTPLTTDTLLRDETSNVVKCDFPALVCFLCHDAVEKSIKGVLYAFCGLRQDLANCSNLVLLHNFLDSSPHCPRALVISIKECVMIVNRHENRSRFPNYQNPPCAPVSIYTLKDAREAFAATKKFFHSLQTEEKFHSVLGDLGQIPTVASADVFPSLPNSPGKCYSMLSFI